MIRNLLPPAVALGWVLSVTLVAAADDRVDAMLSAANDGNVSDAMAIASDVSSGWADGATSPPIRTLAAVLQIARQCQSGGQVETAGDLFDRVSRCLAKPDGQLAAALPPARRVDVWITAGECLSRGGRHGEALRWLTAAAALDASTQTARLAKSLVGVGSGSLDQNQFSDAVAAYEATIRLDHADTLAVGRLGLAWSLTMSGDRDSDALAAIDDFLNNHPDHPDAASAALMKMGCLERQNAAPEAGQVAAEVLQRYPRHEAAVEVVAAMAPRVTLREIAMEPNLPLPRYLRTNAEFVIQNLRRGDAAPAASAALLARGWMAAWGGGQSDLADVAAQTRFAATLGQVDATGQPSTELLQTLIDLNRPTDAESLARVWINAAAAFASESEVGDLMDLSPAVGEAACRWAGRTGRWSLLADAAKNRTPRLDQSPAGMDAGGDAERDEPSPAQLHVARLLAESLLQTGQQRLALKWWEAIVDRGGADDFPSLLRCAEAAVAAGTIPQATTRLAAARGAADATTGDASLVDLLTADTEIRQLKFDHGRSLLERVVRSAHTPQHLRGRAQWMIGETFFMQQRFADAIDAYRLVEGIGGDDQWTAASLVQAGKSFEQLGRTREAAVCYSTLVSRFGDSEHATGARHRLAALGPVTPDPQGSMRR